MTTTAAADAACTTGRSRDAGWQLSVRRTLPLRADDAWDRLHEAWLPEWTGADRVPLLVGAPVRRDDVHIGRVIGCHVGRRLRLRWAPEGITHETVLQATVLESGDGTALALHQEQLCGPEEQRRLLEEWTGALEALRERLLREVEESRNAEPALG